MKKTRSHASLVYWAVWLSLLVSCTGKNTAPSNESISEIDLKRGDVILCGPPDQQLGTVEFLTSCSPDTKKDVDLAVALLHSFEYEEAEKAFAKVIDQEPACAMAYWGVAMSNYHQVWPSLPTQAELEKGSRAIAIAQALTKKSELEAGFIAAMAVFYKDYQTVDHRTRSLNFEQAMEKLHKAYPTEKEVAIFYALSLVGASDPKDKSYRKQRKAGAILTSLYPNEPNHPGIVHYLIHSYDYPELAALALPAAKKYASIAPSSAHAQHMPSHIFTRLGLWDACIQSNLTSTSSAQCYAEMAGIKGTWDEELHAMDYLVYGYLQKGDNELAKQQVDYLRSITEVYPVNFKDAYAFAAIPTRYVLENKRWKEAANLEMHPSDFPWQKFPWQAAMVHFARLLGSAHVGNLEAAKTELKQLNSLYDTLIAQKDAYKANQVMIQVKAGEAWILLEAGKSADAVRMMNLAADMEDKTGKSPVTPGEVLPAKELLADMLLQLNKPVEALEAYEAALKTHPNRFNSLFGAGIASEKSNKAEKARRYYQQLITIANSPKANRPELATAQSFLKEEQL